METNQCLEFVWIDVIFYENNLLIIPQNKNNVPTADHNPKQNYRYVYLFTVVFGWHIYAAVKVPSIRDMSRV